MEKVTWQQIAVLLRVTVKQHVQQQDASWTVSCYEIPMCLLCKSRKKIIQSSTGFSTESTLFFTVLLTTSRSLTVTCSCDRLWLSLLQWNALFWLATEHCFLNTGHFISVQFQKVQDCCLILPQIRHKTLLQQVACGHDWDIFGLLVRASTAI